MSAIIRELLKNYYSLDESTKLDLDRAIKTLADAGELDDQDILHIQLIVEQASFSDKMKVLGICQSTMKLRFISISSKIASFLGEDYQDKKILEEVTRRLKRPLTEVEEKFCWEVIRRGRSLGGGINIYNFKVDENGQIVVGEDKEEGQVDV
jgi:hypothetical protein